MENTQTQAPLVNLTPKEIDELRDFAERVSDGSAQRTLLSWVKPLQAQRYESRVQLAFGF